MKSFQGVLLILGSLFLYSSMTCMYMPLQTSPAETTQSKVIVDRHEPAAETQKTQTFANKADNIFQTKAIEEKQQFWNFMAQLRHSKQPRANVIVERTIRVSEPGYTRGIYLSNNSGNSVKRMKAFIKQARAHNINTFVIDVQPRMPKQSILAMVRKAGIYPVSRVVVFEGGLKTRTPSAKHINKVLSAVRRSASAGFLEAQLDYIRYADYKSLRRLSLKYKYSVIEGILSRARQVADSSGIKLGADVFGRITLNNNDHIGQRLENFAKYMHVIYPMVYPSHYTGDSFRISKPYHTVKEGIFKSKQRIKTSRIVAYIQGFTWRVDRSGLSLSEYVRKQMRACEDAGGDGWVIWNPRNAYAASYNAMRRDAKIKAKYANVEPKETKPIEPSLMKKKPLEKRAKKLEPCLTGSCAQTLSKDDIEG